MEEDGSCMEGMLHFLKSSRNEFSVEDIPTDFPVRTGAAEREHLEGKAMQLSNQLHELEQRKNRKELLILNDNIENPMLKIRFRHELVEITQRFNEICHQYYTCLLEGKAMQLSNQLHELEKRKNRKELLILDDDIENPMLKLRFRHEFEELTQRFNETRQQYFTCLAMLGRTK